MEPPGNDTRTTLYGGDAELLDNKAEEAFFILGHIYLCIQHAFPRMQHAWLQNTTVYLFGDLGRAAQCSACNNVQIV